MGRSVYEGVYEPSSRHADEDGCRRDVLEALRGLGLTIVRYPGGNFVSGYHWRDGVGPREQRPTVRELAWQSIEPNHFGTDEFMRLCRKLDWQPMLAVNLGTGTPEEARHWVEYCNCPAGTQQADLRAKNGHTEPFGVKLWCLGNEMDGPWQLGHVPAAQYAIRAQQAAKLMKDTDRSLETVACGSSGPWLRTYGEWDRQVLEGLGDYADYISLHRYVDNRADDSESFLAMGLAIDRQIEEIDAVCRAVQAQRKSRKRAYLCFDEWNVWYKNMEMSGAGVFAPHLIEEIYNLEDALVVASFLNSFVRHADVVRIANLAQLVNVIAPLVTRGDELLVQSIYHAFRMFSTRRDGISLRVAQTGPSYASKHFERVPVIDASAVLGEDTLHVFAVNRSLTQAAPLRIERGDRPLGALASAELLTGPNAKAANSFECQDVIVARPYPDVRLRDGAATLELPPLSFAALTFRP
ncbi:MAG: alpha-N-arabinofuranosidase [Betaproteobacteria bacterium]|nr:alpha-N-arabinofuranosidase [Betaproteobacteria bacterium]